MVSMSCLSNSCCTVRMVYNGYNIWLYDTSSNDTSSTEPFRRKGFLSKCHFVECPLPRNRFSSNTRRNILCSLGGHIVSADPVTMYMYYVIVKLRALVKITGLKLTRSFY